MKILSFPKYDSVSDSFVDGPMPQTADTFFNDDNQMKEFFQIKPFKGANHSDDSSHNIQ
jgi:hypothetical protein